MIQLTEKMVVEVALAYLKGHYRFMERVERARVGTGAHADGGIVADGYLTFSRNEDGDQFLATVEATDYMVREELRYTMYWELLIIDSLTIGLSLLAIFAGWAHIRGTPSVYPAGPGWSLLLLVLLLILLAGVLFLLLRPLRRYHYIYAIEQFKQYYADDQWIAFAWDVFPSKEDRYYKELRAQCITYGFGLLEIDRQRHVKLHLSPTQVDVFQNRRRIRQFRGGQELGQLVRRGMRQLPALPAGRLPDLGGDLNRLFRFRRSYRHQLLISTLSVVLVGIFFRQELAERPIRYVDNARAWEREARQRRSRFGPQSPYFFVDSAQVPAPMPNVRGYLDLRPRSDAFLLPEGAAPAGEALLYLDGTFRSLSCDRLLAGQQARYVVYLRSYSDVAFAKSEALQLRRSNVAVNLIWADCLFAGRRFYLMIYEDLFDDFAKAKATRDQLQELLIDLNIDLQPNIGRINT